MRPLLRALLLIVLLSANAFGAESAPKRIVSLAPSFTEILFALGMGDHIVGNTNYCDYPDAAKDITKVGDIMNPNVERIISLQPDLVFAGKWKWEVPDKLRKVGITVVEVADAETLQDSMDRILFFGDQTGTRPKAEEIVASMKSRIDELRKRGARLMPKPLVFAELDAGQWTVGRKSYMNDVFQVLGLANIFGDRNEPYLMVTMESIVARKPDLLISICRTAKEYSDSPAWSTVQAVHNGKIIDKDAIDWNALMHQGPRLVDGIAKLQAMVNELMLEKQ